MKSLSEQNAALNQWAAKRFGTAKRKRAPTKRQQYQRAKKDALRARAEWREEGTPDANLDLTRLGNAIRSSRIAAGLTQHAAAKAAGISQPHWSDVENSLETPTLKTLVRMSAAIGVQAHVWIKAAVAEEEIDHVRK
jgi:ribosome-binding protein aMBF1 (putative translation factor)